MESTSPELSPQERARLARKGEALYAKSCGPGGRGDCAGSFALHQWRLGHIEVVRDLLGFVEDHLVALRSSDPDGLLPATEALAARLRGLLEDRPSCKM